MAENPMIRAYDLTSGDRTQPGYIMRQLTAVGAAPAADVDCTLAGDYGAAANTLPRSLYVGGAGNLVVTDAYGVTATFVSGDNQYHPIRPAIVESATTATGIVAIY